MTPRLGEAPGDLQGLDPELVERRRAFVARYTAERGWPGDPARLTDVQLFEILNHEEWPK